ncbi:hypothetical protein [Shimia aestuarii]|uniref:Uncharacterized protein n=1 Tax=Shimia aestuarii TaxID=254406 RepID=A0A1I4IPM7_9RHOB|nr:hypothetical protein [Shimia aestuarii]SFL55943.1 hypothetical protein SAMN04488042_101680 [Shimia aestuarii]
MDTIVDLNATVTLLTSHGKPLCKTFTQTPDGVVSTPSANMHKGLAQEVYARTPVELARLLDGLTQQQAIALGSLKSGKASAALTTKRHATGDVIARSTDHLHFKPDRLAWFLLDFDTKAMPDHVAERIADMGGPWPALCAIWPELAHAASVVRPSSSDGVTGADGAVRRSDGIHVYVLMHLTCPMSETLKTLQARAWVLGLGWLMISKAGDFLVRSIVDTTVGSPERLVYEAPPILGPGVARYPRPTIIQDGIALMGLPTHEADKAKADVLIAQAKRGLADRAAEIKEKHMAERVADLVERKKIAPKLARKIIEQRVNGCVLDDRDTLQIDTGEWVAVGDILDDPGTWDRRGIPDPIEGLEYGPDKATLMLTPRVGHPTDRPVIVSHAHGKKTVFRFKRYEMTAPPDLGPHYPAPTEPRQEAIKAHGRTVEDWADAAFKTVRASRDVKALEEMDEYDRAVAVGEIMGRYGLDHTPRSYLTRNSNAPRWMLTGALGVGKTETILRVLVENPDVTALFLVPDHQMAEEVAERYLAMGGDRAMVLRGRAMVDPEVEGEKMCLMAHRAAQVLKHGLSVRSALCEKCPKRNQCGYMRQARFLSGARAVFAPHDWAWFQLPGDFKPDVVIFDERPRDFGINVHDLPVDWLLSDLVFDGGDAFETMDALSARHHILHPLMRTLHYAARLYPWAMLAVLRQYGWTRDHLAEAVRVVDLFGARGVLRGCRNFVMHDLCKVDEVLCAPPRPIQEFKALLMALEAEIDLGHLNPTTVRLTSDDSFRITTTKTLANVPNAPFLHLDGTGDEALANAWFGALDHRNHKVERNAYVTQVTGHSFSKAYMTAGGGEWQGEWKDRSEAFQADLWGVVRADEGAAVFSYKATKPDGWFGALRGLDRWANHPSGYVIGRNQPGPRDVEHLAAPFAVRAGHVIQSSEYGQEWRGIRMRDGSVTPQLVDVHPDPWVQRVLEQIRERESEQAMDRLRLIHNPQRKSIYLLMPIVLDQTVDRVIDWKDFVRGGERIERAIRRYGFLPMSGKECVRLFPDIWDNRMTANRDLEPLQGATAETFVTFGNKESLITECYQCLYQRNAHYAHSVKAFVFATAATARERIAEIVGELRSFELLE